MAAIAPERATVPAGAPTVGRVGQVTGPVIDAEFEGGHLPDIYNALVIAQPAADGRPALNVTLEVQQHIGRNQVRAVAMEATDGVVRGRAGTETGAPLR